MKIVNNILLSELKEITEKTFGILVKAVVDIEKGIMAIDAELHSDEEALLLENGSRQRDIWGINLYPAQSGNDFIEFDSMINLRPSQGNMSRGVDNPEARERIMAVVNKIIKR